MFVHSLPPLSILFSLLFCYNRSAARCRPATNPIGVSPDIGDPRRIFGAGLRLLLGVWIGVRFLQLAVNGRLLDNRMSHDSLSRTADPAVIRRIPGDLFVLTDVFALPESAALRRIL